MAAQRLGQNMTIYILARQFGEGNMFSDPLSRGHWELFYTGTKQVHGDNATTAGSDARIQGSCHSRGGHPAMKHTAGWGGRQGFSSPPYVWGFWNLGESW